MCQTLKNLEVLTAEQALFAKHRHETWLIYANERGWQITKTKKYQV